MLQFRLKFFTELRSLEIEMLEWFGNFKKPKIKIYNEEDSDFYYVYKLKVFIWDYLFKITLARLKEEE